MFRPHAPLFAALLLTACAPTLPDPENIERLNPLTLDFAQIRVMADLPSGLELQPGFPKLTFVARAKTTAQVTAPLVAEGGALALRGVDAAQFNKLRDRLRAHKAAGGTGSGAITIALETCATGANPVEGSIALTAIPAPGAPIIALLPSTGPNLLARRTGRTYTQPCT